MSHTIIVALLLPLAVLATVLWTRQTVRWWVYRAYRSPEAQRVRIATILLQLAIFVTPVFLALPDPYRFTDQPIWWVQGLGLLAYYVGIGLAVWAKVVMGQSWGPPGTRPDARDRAVRLVTEGPFRYTRNPIYFGLWFGLMGAYLALENWFVLGVLAIGLLFPTLLRAEEEILRDMFGDTYAAYARRTSRWWPRRPRAT